MTTETKLPLADGTRIGMLLNANALGPVAAPLGRWPRRGRRGPRWTEPLPRGLGVLTSAMAELTIAAQWSAAFVFHPCQ